MIEDAKSETTRKFPDENAPTKDFLPSFLFFSRDGGDPS